MAAPVRELGWVVHFAPVVRFTPLSPAEISPQCPHIPITPPRYLARQSRQAAIPDPSHPVFPRRARCLVLRLQSGALCWASTWHELPSSDGLIRRGELRVSDEDRLTPRAVGESGHGSDGRIVRATQISQKCIKIGTPASMWIFSLERRMFDPILRLD